MDPSPTFADHVFVVLFAIVYPVAGFVSFRRLLRRIEAGQSVPRRRLYANTLIGHWVLLLIGLYLWFAGSRPADLLGLGLTVDTGFLLAAAIACLGIGLLLSQLRAATAADRDFLDALERAFGTLRHLLPRTRKELYGFYGVGLTAGIVEEILWRGYLMAYLGTMMPTLWAALVVTLGFGLAHAYQGWRAIPRVTAVGGVFMALFLLSGSLWLPILLHAAVDMLQGRMAYEVLKGSAEGRQADSG